MALKWTQTLTQMNTRFIYFDVKSSKSWNPRDISKLVQVMYYISRNGLYLNRRSNPSLPVTSTHPSVQWPAVTTQSGLMIEAPHIWEPMYSYDTWKNYFQRFHLKRTLHYIKTLPNMCNWHSFLYIITPCYDTSDPLYKAAKMDAKIIYF